MAIMPGANNEDALKIAERIRFAVSENAIKYGDSTVNATMSLGVDSYPASEIEDPMQLIVNADTALYKAKNSGRNKSVVFGQLSS